eukprot:gene305-310_t
MSIVKRGAVNDAGVNVDAASDRMDVDDNAGHIGSQQPQSESTSDGALSETSSVASDTSEDEEIHRKLRCRLLSGGQSPGKHEAKRWLN